MRILAIDPGYERLGIAVLEKKLRGKEEVVFSSCLRTSKEEEHSKRLEAIGKGVADVIAKYKPEVLAIEKLFLVTNHKTAMAVAEARGVILHEAAKRNMPVREFTPLQVKIAVTGYGRSDKTQVTAMVERLIQLPAGKRLDDEYDAIAIGLTCFATLRVT
ncbi:MAG: crossover junction endodeoxyribonuclease RuvC [bacterium]|nr:crossover junction endodeoxyribonuclease RuvC [bacterium]